MKPEQLKMAFGRLGDLDPVHPDEKFPVPYRATELTVREMTATDVWSAAEHQWSKGKGVVGQALMGLYHLVELEVCGGQEGYPLGLGTVPIDGIAPWFYEQIRFPPNVVPAP